MASSRSTSGGKNKGISKEETHHYLQIRDFLITLARRAGTMITSERPVSTDTSTKKNSVDLVTETDQAVETMISTAIRERYPKSHFMGEETYQPGQTLGEEPTFVVDPIDGTTNFVHGYPYVSVSLGYCEGRMPRVGVVFNPFTETLYAGVRGAGSWVQQGMQGEKRKLPLREPEALPGLERALVAVEWGSDRAGVNWECKTETWKRLGGSKEEGGAMVHSARSFGSAALNLCAVAEGGIDLYWEGGCWAWDVCAGWVVLVEAGGVVVDGNPGVWGKGIEVDGRKYLAVRGMPDGETGQRRVVEEFWGFIEGRMEYEH